MEGILRLIRQGWYWPLERFWTFTPWGWAVAVIWNISELIGKPMPYAGEAFGVIIGCKGQRVECQKDLRK